MFEVDSSAVDYDLELILWFYQEMSSSVDPPTHELDAKLFLRFQVKVSRKLFELDPSWFYYFKLTCLGKLVELDLGWFYDFKLKMKDVESWSQLWIDLS